VQGAARKFFFFTVVGSGVAGMKKARVAMHKAGVYNAFAGVVADVFAAGGVDDFDAATVLAKLRKDHHGEASL
jgi:hypothetical protein